LTVRKDGLVIASDFDGTLLEYDLAEEALKRFAEGDWRRYDSLLADGRISLEECMRSQYSMIRAKSHEEIIDYIDQFCVFREGFSQLISGCASKGIEFVVVSAGLDFCIEHAFKKTGLSPKTVVCPRSQLTSGTGIKVSFPASPFQDAANYKEGLVMSYKRQGRPVAYIGNGRGDLEAAARSDFVFAIADSTLERECVRDLATVLSGLGL
jgi:2-hydroxy-3-keto-5-methylthiopentenyl-1-phosphate phosphatase